MARSTSLARDTRRRRCALSDVWKCQSRPRVALADVSSTVDAKNGDELVALNGKLVAPPEGEGDVRRLRDEMAEAGRAAVRVRQVGTFRRPSLDARRGTAISFLQDRAKAVEMIPRDTGDL